MRKIEIGIQVKEHRDSGLLVALSDDLHGFVVRAYSEDDLTGKLATAFRNFMAAIGTPVRNVEVVKNESVPGIGAPAYIARGFLYKTCLSG